MPINVNVIKTIEPSIYMQGWESFITSLVNQITTNLKRIHGLGVKKVAVNALQPLGCLPSFTATSSFHKCNETINSLVSFHNLLLQQAVAKLNNETKDSPFVILDLYDSFMSILNSQGKQAPMDDYSFPNIMKLPVH